MLHKLTQIAVLAAKFQRAEGSSSTEILMRPRKYSVAVSVLICLIFGLLASSPSSRVSAAPEFVLQFDGVDDRVTFGAAPGARRADLHAGAVVQEDGRRRRTTTSGTGGVDVGDSAADEGARRGRGQQRRHELLPRASTARSACWRPTSRTRSTAATIRCSGRTAICDNIWYHAAATYDGTTWRLFLNGELDAMVDGRHAGAVHAALRQHSARGARRRR